MKTINQELRAILIKAQKNEITESIIYDKLSKIIKTENEKQIFKDLSLSELWHYNLWKSYTQTDVEPNNLKVWYFVFITRFLWLSFGIKLMENWEWTSQVNYKELINEIPEMSDVIKAEEEHEAKLIWLINDNKLKYLSSIVLWLNDALVEITWALAWLSMTLQNPKIVWISGLIIGISAAISMASSEYLSSKSEENDEISPKKAAVYTWIAYIFTVIALVLPFLFNLGIYLALTLSLGTAILIIALFNYYISVAKNESFKARFLEMAWISIWVAIFSFLLWLVVNNVFWISI